MRREKAIIGLAASLALVGLAGRDVGAANGWEESLNGSGTSTSTSQATSSVSLALNSGTIQTDLDAANASTNPDEAGKVLSQTATITVGNTDGYNVYVSGNANLTGRNNSSHRIPSVSSSKTLGNMSNEWGYYATLGDTETSFNPSSSFKAMTTSQQSVGTGGATSNSVTKKLTLFYGARVNSSAAEDFYGNTVTLSVVAQPRTVTTTFATFDGETTMQGLTAAKCKKSNPHDTKKLRDTRDGKYYWVTRTLDGNCWMSQNLALDLSTNKTLTSSDSNISSWTPVHNTSSSPTDGSFTQTETYSWNFGNYVIINPTGTSNCSNNKTGLSACSSQFIAVGSRTPSADPNFYKNNGNKTYTDTEYDAHYLAGNYYMWNTATAGTGGTIIDANAAGSICPKNWRLPDATPNSTANGTFRQLMQQYGLIKANGAGAASGTSSINNKDYNIALSPLFFVRAGLVFPGSEFQGAGRIGYVWSSRASSDVELSYFLHISYTLGFVGVNPSNSFSRYCAYAVRCLVPTS